MSAIPARPLETALHVRVAEALGWSQIGPGNSMNMGDPGIGYPPVNAIVGHKEPIPRYDIDWSATGPLIEKYGITLTCDPYDSEWVARKGDLFVDEWWMPLPAVCELLIFLKGAGKL